MRIIIAGSTSWPTEDLYKVENVILEYVKKTTRAGDEITFVYGDNDKGVETFVPIIALKLPMNRTVMQECFETDHAIPHVKKPRHHTNQRIVDSGADSCLAFFHNSSREVHNLTNKAEAANICVRRFNYNSL